MALIGSQGCFIISLLIDFLKPLKKITKGYNANLYQLNGKFRDSKPGMQKKKHLLLEYKGALAMGKLRVLNYKLLEYRFTRKINASLDFKKDSLSPGQNLFSSLSYI